jgi:hypothetical protein
LRIDYEDENDDEDETVHGPGAIQAPECLPNFLFFLGKSLMFWARL